MMIQLNDDPHSPYFLHPADHPGVRVINELFTGENFTVWRRSIGACTSLCHKLYGRTYPQGVYMLLWQKSKKQWCLRSNWMIVVYEIEIMVLDNERLLYSTREADGARVSKIRCIFMYTLES